MNQPGAYECARARNDALVHIRNLNAPDNSEKKILMLQDSFSWYSTSFLACDIGAVDTIHPSVFSGSVRNYIAQTRPNAVIWLLQPLNPGDILLTKQMIVLLYTKESLFHS